MGNKKKESESYMLIDVILLYNPIKCIFFMVANYVKCDSEIKKKQQQ